MRPNPGPLREQRGLSHGSCLNSGDFVVRNARKGRRLGFGRRRSSSGRCCSSGTRLGRFCGIGQRRGGKRGEVVVGLTIAFGFKKVMKARIELGGKSRLESLEKETMGN
jgi:hypothetical protein